MQDLTCSIMYKIHNKYENLRPPLLLTNIKLKTVDGFPLIYTDKARLRSSQWELIIINKHVLSLPQQGDLEIRC